MPCPYEYPLCHLFSAIRPIRAYQLLRMASLFSFSSAPLCGGQAAAFSHAANLFPACSAFIGG